MKWRAVIGALLLISLGVFLGGTVLRDQVANATALAQTTLVREQNLDAQGNIKVHEQGTTDVNVTNGSLAVAPLPSTRHTHSQMVGSPGGVGTNQFAPIAASLVSITRMEGDGVVDLLSGGVQVLTYRTDGGPVVLPLTQPLTVDVIRLTCAATQCGAEVNVVGR